MGHYKLLHLMTEPSVSDSTESLEQSWWLHKVAFTWSVWNYFEVHISQLIRMSHVLHPFFVHKKDYWWTKFSLCLYPWENIFHITYTDLKIYPRILYKDDIFTWWHQVVLGLFHKLLFSVISMWKMQTFIQK